MSYTTNIKKEIIDIVESKTESLAVLSAYVRNNGFIENNKLYLSTEKEYIKDKIEKVFKDLYEININIEVKDSLNFSKNNLYLISIIDKLDFILKDLGYFSDNNEYLESPPEYLVDDNSTIRAYLRGAFLCCGSINDPKTSRYHMEILINKPEEAVFVQKLLNLFDLNAKMLIRDKKYMIYIKEADKISDFLKLIGASNAVLYFEDVRIYRDAKNRTNRLNNCEQANTDKIVASAMTQLENIQVLEDNLAVELLDEGTKEALEYRKKYKEASLKELSEIISLETGKKITKSGLNHRFRKISELADRLRKKQ